MKKFLIPILTLTVLLATGCSGKLFTVHKVDVRQGNALTLEDIEKIGLGTPQSQVKQLLGLPVVIPAFNPTRWDYVYYLRSQEKPDEKRGLSVYFDQGKVSSMKRF